MNIVFRLVRYDWILDGKFKYQDKFVWTKKNWLCIQEDRTLTFYRKATSNEQK